jgi:Zn ribbon nucleic-acid-binding protein
VSPDAVIVENLRGVVYTLLALCGGLTMAVWMLAGQAHRGCVNCAHCNIRNAEEVKRRDAVQEESLRSLGVSQEEIDAKMAKRAAKRAAREERASRNRDGRP